MSTSAAFIECPLGLTVQKKNTKASFLEFCTSIEDRIPVFNCINAATDPHWLIKDVLYHLMLPLTPNGLREYYRYYDLKLDNFPFQDLLERAGRLAEKVNTFLLQKISDLVIYLEADETFKGRNTIFLVVIDKFTGFLLFFREIRNKKQGTIRTALEPLRDAFPNVKVVFTDLAVYYPKVVEDLFPGVDHQLCVIHGLRSLFGEYNKIRHRFLKAQGQAKIKSEQLENYKVDIRKRQKIVSKKRNALNRQLQKRNELYLMLGIKSHQKGIYQKFPEIKKIAKKINKKCAEVRSMTTTLSGNYNKRRKLKQELDFLTQDVNTLWGKYMESRRLWKRFKRLLRGEITDFSKEWKRFTEILNKAKNVHDLNPFVVKIQHLMTDYPNLFTLAGQGKTSILAPNFWNTNRVECFNGIFRSFSDLRRHFPCIKQTDALCALWQLYYNTTPRRSKKGDHLSPIERYGINLNGRDWVSLLFEPLPQMIIMRE